MRVRANLYGNLAAPALLGFFGQVNGRKAGGGGGGATDDVLCGAGGDDGLMMMLALAAVGSGSPRATFRQGVIVIHRQAKSAHWVHSLWLAENSRQNLRPFRSVPHTNYRNRPNPRCVYGVFHQFCRVQVFLVLETHSRLLHQIVQGG